MANLSIATDEGYIDRQSGERVDKTEWHRVVTFQPGLVDMFEKHAKKGRLVLRGGQAADPPVEEGRGGRRPVLHGDPCWRRGGRVQFLDKPNGQTADRCRNRRWRPPRLRRPMLRRTPTTFPSRLLPFLLPSLGPALRRLPFFLPLVPSELRSVPASGAPRGASPLRLPARRRRPTAYRAFPVHPEETRHA